MEKLTIAILHALVHVCVCVYVCAGLSCCAWQRFLKNRDCKDTVKFFENNMFWQRNTCKNNWIDYLDIPDFIPLWWNHKFWNLKCGSQQTNLRSRTLLKLQRGVIKISDVESGKRTFPYWIRNELRKVKWLKYLLCKNCRFSISGSTRSRFGSISN